jgi:phosphatidylserine decarboxylase
MNYPHPLIAREGWPYIAIAVVLALIAWRFGGWWWSLPLWLLVAFVVQFFRDPPRVVPTQANVVLSPADGRIVQVGQAHDPYLKRDALKISVFMNVFNVHSNRSPVDGAVENIWYFPGAFVNAALDKASTDNERNAVWIKAANGADVTCVQVAGLIARRILCYIGRGDQLARGQRYGFIRFGSRVDVYLPTNAKARVAIGDKVAATSTVLAELNDSLTRAPLPNARTDAG